MCLKTNRTTVFSVPEHVSVDEAQEKERERQKNEGRKERKDEKTKSIAHGVFLKMFGFISVHYKVLNLACNMDQHLWSFLRGLFVYLFYLHGQAAGGEGSKVCRSESHCIAWDLKISDMSARAGRSSKNNTTATKSTKYVLN